MPWSGALKKINNSKPTDAHPRRVEQIFRRQMLWALPICTDGAVAHIEMGLLPSLVQAVAARFWKALRALILRCGLGPAPAVHVLLHHLVRRRNSHASISATNLPRHTSDPSINTLPFDVHRGECFSLAKGKRKNSNRRSCVASATTGSNGALAPSTIHLLRGACTFRKGFPYTVRSPGRRWVK